MRRQLLTLLCAMATMATEAQIQTNAGIQYLQCMPKDMSTDFSDLSNTYFLSTRIKVRDCCNGNATDCRRDRHST